MYTMTSGIYLSFLFLIPTLVRSSDLGTKCKDQTEDEHVGALWRDGIRSIAVKSGLRWLRSLSTFPNMKRGKMNTLMYISFIILTCSSDIESNPGPRSPKYPCQIWNKEVTWKQRGVACHDCNLWYNVDCMNMPSQIYNCLNNVFWHCVSCRMPQFHVQLFRHFWHGHRELIYQCAQRKWLDRTTRCLLIT